MIKRLVVVIVRPVGLELTATSVNARRINTALNAPKPVNVKATALSCAILMTASVIASQVGVAQPAIVHARSSNLERTAPSNATAETTRSVHRLMELASVHQALQATSASLTAQLELMVKIAHSDATAKTTLSAITKLVNASASRGGQDSSARGLAK